MAKQTVGIGSVADDGTGDNLRNGMDKVNDNFNEIYTLLGDGTDLTSGFSATTSVVTLAGPTVTGVASFAAGSAGAPSITKTGDTDTGIFFSAANEVAFTTGGTQRLKLDNTTATFAGAITGGGTLTTGGNVVIPDAGTVGSASSTSAMTIASTGIVTFADDIVIKDAGTIGNATTPAAVQIEADGDIVLSDDLYISGGLLDLKNEGSVSQIKLYCEVSNAHAQTLQSAPHTEASSAVCVLPTQSGTLIGTGDTGTLPLAAIDIDGGTDIGAAIADADLFIIDDGAGGTNRKVAASRIKTFVGSGLPRGYLSGLGLSNNSSDTEHDIDIAVGEARDTADGVDLTIASTFTKKIDATWASGSGNGGMANGVSLAGDTWYHVYLVELDAGGTDAGFDTSTTAANLVATSGVASAYRRIGSVLTDSSSNILNFTQFQNEFIYDVQINNVNGSALGTSRVLQAVSAPLGFETQAILGLLGVVSGSNSGVRITLTHPNVTDATPASDNVNNAGENSSNNNGTWASGTHIVRTNTSSQVAFRQDFNSTVYINTNGYIDERGHY